MAELEGKTLDRYELRQTIGKGGMANVYEAYDPSFHRVVAIKVFKREDDEMLQRFIREARLMASLNHPHLVQIYDSGECQIDGVSHSYIVMPKLTGGTLRMRIRREPLSLAEVCQCLEDVAGALDYIHAKGIIHRDIKASNVLLDDENRCYLADFGIARIVNDATQLTTTGNVLGTVDYVAPELFEVHRRADARSDLYALGVLLYEMVTGRLPFSADNPLALVAMHANKQPPSPCQYVSQLSSQVEGVMLKALEKQPERRYGSAAELTEAFCNAVNVSSSRVAVAQDEIETAVMSMESLTVAPGRNLLDTRPAPLADGTEGFVVASPVQLVLSSISEDTQPSLPLRASQSVRQMRSKRPIIFIIMVFVVLLILSVPVTYALLNNSTRTGGGTGLSTATPIGSTLQDAINATATAQAAVTATANAQTSATVGPILTATSGQPAYQNA
ncbi:MAG: serine/threonine-protein kinase, partial [Ktedonobacteraceae bacterium]